MIVGRFQVKRAGVLVAVLLIACIIFALKVEGIYVSWTYAYSRGSQYLGKVPPTVESAFFESVPEEVEAAVKLRQLAAFGFELIYATNYGYMDSVIEAVKEFPNTVFMHCSGFKRAENMGTYFGRIYQADYQSRSHYLEKDKDSERLPGCVINIHSGADRLVSNAKSRLCLRIEGNGLGS